jgi:hypothetical protein
MASTFDRKAISIEKVSASFRAAGRQSKAETSVIFTTAFPFMVGIAMANELPIEMPEFTRRTRIDIWKPENFSFPLTIGNGIDQTR